MAQGAIGQLLQVHGICMGDLLTDGTHNIDLLRFYAGDAAIQWVFAQVDLSEIKVRYGHLVEKGALVNFAFASGVRGVMELGSAAPAAYQKAYLYGTEGMLEVGGDRNLQLRLIRPGLSAPEIITPPEANPFQLEVEALLQTLAHGATHPLDGQQAQANLEVLMAAFESARRHTVIPLPLAIADHPLAQMVEQLPITPEVEVGRRQQRLGA